MAKKAVRRKAAPVRRVWSKDDLKVLKGMARKDPLSKIATATLRSAAGKNSATALFAPGQLNPSPIPKKNRNRPVRFSDAEGYNLI